VTARVSEQAVHCGDELQATHDQPSEDVLYFVNTHSMLWT